MEVAGYSKRMIRTTIEKTLEDLIFEKAFSLLGSGIHTMGGHDSFTHIRLAKIKFPVSGDRQTCPTSVQFSECSAFTYGENNQNENNKN
jgi:hypothetical protein